MATPVNATPEQKRASNPAASAWVGANAGSGKTHVLVDRVTRLMLAGVDPMAILCLTFTKAAAKEMANRLHERLGEWVGLPDASLTQRLQQMGTDDKSPQTLAQARRLFTTALETPGGLKIQTIHAFCERILQLFPVEAGLAPGFAVLESSQSKQLLREARDHVLREAQADENSALAQALDIVTRHTHSDSFDALLERLLSRRQVLSSVEGIVRELAVQLGVDQQQQAGSLRLELLTFDREAIGRVISVLSDSGQPTNQKTAENYAALLNITDSAGAEDICRGIYFTSEGETPKKITSIVTPKLQKAYPWIEEWLAREYSRCVGTIAQIDNLVRIEATGALLTLADAMIARFESEKKRRGAYDFDDLILKTRDLLVDKSSTQWVLYKLDRGIEHVLVDEAQDTSLAQWEIVGALTQEFFSGTGSRAAPDRTLFVVGDRKQSIFSFQGADPAAFEGSREIFSALIRNVGQAFNNVDLTISYRSTREVLAAVDTVFAEGTRARIGLDGLHPQTLHHESNRRDDRGLFELRPLVEADEKAEREAWQAPVDQYPPKSAPRKLAQKLAAEIRSRIGKPHMTAPGRMVEAGDILVLFRTRNSLFDILISELRKAGVPVAGADRLKLSESIAVLDVMALVQFVLLPEDDYSLACLLKSPLMPAPLREEELFELAHGRGTTSLWTRLSTSGNGSCSKAHAILQDWREFSEGARPFEFLSAVLIKTRKAFLARLGSEAGDALDALLEASLTYEENHSSSLAGFATWFASEDTDIKRNMDRGNGEVRLMTVHGAKGLESSIVILPDTTSTPRNNAASALMFVDPSGDGPKLPFWRLSGLSQSQAIEDWKNNDKRLELEEQRRLLYVAMTRARDGLYVCGYKSKNRLDENSWYALVAEAFPNPGESQGSTAYAEAAPPDRHRMEPNSPAWLFSTPSHPDTQPKSGPSVHMRSAGSKAAVARGRVIHKLLQDLPGEAPEKQLEFVQQRLAKNQLDPGLADRIVHLISVPEHRDFFGEGSQAEVSIGSMAPGGQRRMGRIDRLVIRRDEILLLDYKTDWDVPEALTADHDYVQQLGFYAMVLGQAHSGRTVRAAILWTALPRLDWIEAETLQKTISNMAAIT